MQTKNSKPTPRVQEQPEQFDEFTGGYDMEDHNRAAARINADMRKMPTPRDGHTPGPWKVRDPHTSSMMVNVTGANGVSVACVGTAKDQQTAPDAKLIASAPCMLAALQDILLDMAANESNGLSVKSARNWASVNRARAAIARATGGGQ
jgi:hypothetical protein